MGFDSLKRLTQVTGRLAEGLSGSFGTLNQTGPAIGVDFGVASLKLLQVTPGEPPNLIAAAQADTPLEMRGKDAARIDWQLQQLPRLIKQGGFKGRRVVCAIPASQMYVRHMQLPAGGGDISALVAGSLAAELQCDPEALAVRNVEVAPIGATGKFEQICMATARELVVRLMTGMKGAKLEPVGMHSEFQAVLKAFEFAQRRASDQGHATLYMDMGATSTKIAIAQDGRLVFCRKIDIGGWHLDHAVAVQHNLEIGEARRRRYAMTTFGPAQPEPEQGLALLSAGMSAAGQAGGQSGAGGTSAEPAVAVAPRPMRAGGIHEPLEMLRDEIAMCLRYHDAMFPTMKADRMVFLGGEARHRALCQHIAKSLRLSAQLADPLARVGRTGNEPATGVDAKEAQPGWTVALGLCLMPTDL
ncbi:MAG: pilus assembly protein PilM [Planctomycetota bacterium]|nr:pilus assembly protein PilM [Planctomycetota bacterium]